MPAFPRLFRQFIVRSLLREKLRAVLATLGIALGVAVVTAIRLANVSVTESFRRAVESVGGAASLRVVSAAGMLNELRVSDLSWLDQYGSVSPVLENYAMYVDDDLAAESSSGGADSSPDGGERVLARGELLYVLGVDVLRDLPIRDYRLRTSTADESPRPRELLNLLIDDHAIILTERFARRKGLVVGDTIRLAFGSRQQELTIRGLLRDEGPARTLQGNFALLDIAAAQWLSDRLGSLDSIDLRIAQGLDVAQVEQEIRGRLPVGLLVERPADQASRSETMIAAFQFNLTALGSVALLVGLFMIYNTVSVSVAARRTEIGILSAAGASPSLVVALFLGEALVLAIIGCAFGLALGQWLSRFAVQATAQTVETFYIAAVAESTAAGTSLSVIEGLGLVGISLALALAAAALPAWQAASIEPVEVIRKAAGTSGIQRQIRRGWQVSVVLSGIALLLTQLPPLAGLPVWGFVAELLFMFAAAFLTPILIREGCRVMGQWIAELVPWGRQVLRLASANLTAAIPQTSVSIAALAMSLGMTIAIGVMVGSFRQTVVYWLDAVLTADLAVKPIMNSSSLSTATIDPAVLERLRQDPAVAATCWYSSRTIPYGESKIRLDTTELSQYLDYGRILFKEPREAEVRIREAIREKRPFVLVSESFSLRHQRHAGQTVSLSTPQGPIEPVIVAVYYDYASNQGTILLDFVQYRQWYGDDLPARSPFAVSLFLKPGADPERTRTRLQETAGAGQSLYFVTNRQVRDEAMRIFESTFTITYALQSIAVLIAGTGVVATLIRLILERKQEIALLSLVGARSGQIRGMVVAEAVMVGAISQVIGIGIGIVLALVLIRVINVQSFGWTIQFQLPWAFLLQSSAAVLLASALFGLYPAYRAAELDALQTLREL